MKILFYFCGKRVTMTGNSLLRLSTPAESRRPMWREKKKEKKKEMFVIKSIIAKLGDIAAKRAQNILMSNKE